MAYPVNVWLVYNHLKHGMGTVRALGEGGEALEPSTTTAMSSMAVKQRSVTRPQLVAVAVLTLTALAVGILLAAAFGSFSM